ncbi:uncharacterized membrane protein YhaH (DUF805 family) [Yoonia maricola]|uniref:Uncharacterized membrane protein YhaH (DUF805 family) n=1 Tax=Yoonia maricola TaxID=420999 RepID=A0A2M8WQ80_9RHOB|nr:DUF805 domain-containing protein [Yoonia maricola]PJI93081.1 uncharacterized membrane protein YhaH (DUF805 family) [Yoonia maricola]
MGFREAIRTCLREKYFTFNGRASRSEYWYFYLFVVLCWIGFIAAFMGLGGIRALDTGEFTAINYVVGALCVVGFLYLMIPNIAVQVRRFHDRNLSGWWVLAGIITSNVPYIGTLVGIAILILTCLKGTDGDNKFGPDPLRTDINSDVFA